MLQDTGATGSGFGLSPFTGSLSPTSRLPQGEVREAKPSSGVWGPGTSKMEWKEPSGKREEALRPGPACAEQRSPASQPEKQSPQSQITKGNVLKLFLPEKNEKNCICACCVAYKPGGVPESWDFWWKE